MAKTLLRLIPCLLMLALFTFPALASPPEGKSKGKGKSAAPAPAPQDAKGKEKIKDADKPKHDDDDDDEEDSGKGGKGRSRCEPLRARDWAERCGSADGRDEIGRHFGDCRRMRSFGNVDSVDDACDILRGGDSLGSCERARRQLLAAALNRASGRLSNSCCIDVDGKQVELRSALVRRDDDCHARRDCDAGRDIMAAFNDSTRVSHCGACDGVHHHSGCGHDDQNDDDHDHGDGHENQKGKGHQKGKGKGHAGDG